MLDPRALERRFIAEAPASAASVPASPKRRRATPKPALTQFQLALAAMLAIAALAVVIAAMRISDRAVYRAAEAREAPARFLANELGALRLFAMTAPSPIPARLYLGIEECFKARVPVPFDDEHLPLARQTLATCADMELGRLYAQGGAPLAQEGGRVLRQASVRTPFSGRENQ